MAREPTMKSHDRLGFSLAEYRRRYDAVVRHIREAGADALLVRGPENITYLTGFETPGYYKYHCLIIAPGEEPVLILRRFEEINVWEYSWLTKTVPVWDHQDPTEETIKTLKAMKLDGKRLGVEKAGWFFSVQEFEGLAAALPKAKLVDCSRAVEEARLIKSDEEIAVMRKAAAIADKAVQAGIEACRPGVTEDDVAARVHHVLCENGGEYMGLPPFILAGPRTSLPHQTWRGEPVRKGEHVYFEVSAAKYRYSSALMRCVSVGEPNKRLRAMSDACIGGLNAAIAAIKPGVSCQDADTACRSVIEKAGFGDSFRHRTGYSIGVNYPPDWGEGQILSIRQGEPRLLQENMTFHLVPLCLIYREIGVGFSATIRVTKTGCEAFTKVPLKLFVNAA